jgi:ribosomal protein L5
MSPLKAMTTRLTSPASRSLKSIGENTPSPNRSHKTMAKPRRMEIITITITLKRRKKSNPLRKILRKKLKKIMDKRGGKDGKMNLRG